MIQKMIEILENMFPPKLPHVHDWHHRKFNRMPEWMRRREHQFGPINCGPVTEHSQPD